MFMPDLWIGRKLTCIHGKLKQIFKNNNEKAWEKDFSNSQNHNNVSTSSATTTSTSSSFDTTKKLLIVKKPDNYEQTMIQYLRLQRNSRPESFDVIFQSILHFPLYSCHQDVAKIGAQAQETDLKVLLLWGDEDEVVPLSNLTKWKTTLSKKNKNVKVYSEVFEGL